MMLRTGGLRGPMGADTAAPRRGRGALERGRRVSLPMLDGVQHAEFPLWELRAID